MTEQPDSRDVVLPAGEIIDGKYEVISTIGRGGMGVVYKARDQMKREVALKMLTHVDGDTIERFRREAIALGSVSHRAVIRVDAFGESSAGPYLVVEYVAGRDLGTLARFPLPIEEAVDLTLAICSGVSSCHAAQIVHRDLKPSNIRVRDVARWSERVKILDFGLALPFDSPILKDHQRRITNLGVVVGTPRYIAPELLRHEPPTPQCDQYGIASMLYLLLTGRAPFRALQGDELLQAILHGDYVAVQLLRSGIPDSLQQAIARGLSQDPAQRFPSVNQLALEIVVHATPSLGASYTRYFSGAQRIDHRLVEPVSMFRRALPPPIPASPEAQYPDPPRPPVQRLVTPGQGSAAGRIPNSAVPDDGRRFAPPLPQAASLAVPETQLVAGKRRPRPPRDYNTLFVFICGAIVGGCLTVGGFICFLLYAYHAPVCVYPSAAPSVQRSLVPTRNDKANAR
jgi:eukaryotic-like serine/threonine-protein kinase